MTGVRINSVGAVTDSSFDGTIVEAHASSSGFMPYKAQAVVTHTLDSTASLINAIPGVNAVSGAFVVTVRLPAASTQQGAMFSFVNVSGKAHVVTASDGSSIVYQRQVSDVGVGSKLTLAANTTGSALLFCDGQKFMVLMASGSTVSGT